MRVDLTGSTVARQGMHVSVLTLIDALWCRFVSDYKHVYTLAYGVCALVDDSCPELRAPSPCGPSRASQS
jgi:hypothetical protein